MRERQPVPVLCGSALQNIGIGPALELHCRVSARRRPNSDHGHRRSRTATEVERKIRTTEPPSAFVFKTMADPFAGRVTYFKVYSGVIKNDDHLLNTRTGSTSGWRMSARPWERPSAASANCMPATSAPWRSCGHAHGRYASDEIVADRYPPMKLPGALHRVSPSQAKSRNDEDRMGNAVHRILEEDQSLRFYRDPQTNEFLLAGTGQQHVESSSAA